jgi:DNA processing protein
MTGRDFVALSLLPGARRRASRALLALSEEALALSDALDLLIGYCTRAPCDTSTLVAQLRSEADVLLARAEGLEVSLIAFGDHEDPASLRTIPDAPVVLWTAGNTTLLAGPGVAIVGSRAASTGGTEIAERLGHDLALAGVTVVSGLARGCDAAAHRGALSAGGTTIAVLGCGPDVIYPAEHRGLYEQVRGSGAIVSELPPGTPPLPAHFPLRNRIISGLSRGVVVVEASEKSGSLITAACALEQGRDVMAVPGSILGSRYRGCHGLLRDGARLVETAADVVEELRLPAPTSVSGPPGATAGHDPMLALLRAEGDGDPDLLAARSGLSVAVVLQRLMALELAGCVRRAPGGRFVRIDR